MRRVIVTVGVTILFAVNCWPQQAGTQTARQALIEMLFSKTPGTFVKHLPQATRTALEKSGAMASLQQYGMFTAQLQTQGQNFQTFETGSVLLSGNDVQGQKIEITVENDTLHSDEDDIELSFRVYKNGEVQHASFMPHMTFAMKQEAEVWKLNEISFTIHVPLADPDLLKAITEKMHSTGDTRLTPAPRSEVSAMPAGNDEQVVGAMRSILAAENTYASRYPAVGYTCTLSDLDGFGGGEPNEHQAMLLESGLASGKRYGYVFSLSECRGGAGFHVTVTPSANSFGRKAFCSDQAGNIRVSDEGNAATCMTRGTALPDASGLAQQIQH